MNVIIFLNVLFSLKIEIQYYLQDFVETQICTVQNMMNTVNKRKLLKLCKFISIILYHVKNPPD